MDQDMAETMTGAEAAAEAVSKRAERLMLRINQACEIGRASAMDEHRVAEYVEACHQRELDETDFSTDHEIRRYLLWLADAGTMSVAEACRRLATFGRDADPDPANVAAELRALRERLAGEGGR